jgi:hypothetical protein
MVARTGPAAEAGPIERRNREARMRIEQYRKTIGAAIGGLLPVVTLIVPGVGAWIAANPEVMAILSAVFGGLGAYAPANRLGGRNVLDVAREASPAATRGR